MSQKEGKPSLDDLPGAGVETARKRDGWHGVITSLEHASGPEILQQHRGLEQVAAAFRTCKSER